MSGWMVRRGTADEAAGVRAPRWASDPPWLRPADLEALAPRFAPLGSAEVRRIALAFAQVSTPVELLLL